MLRLLIALRLLADDPVALDWRAPAHCPDAAAVLDELASLTALDGEARVRVTGNTREVGGRFELALRITTTSMSLRRRLTADRCETLGQAAALLIAIALDPLEVASQVAAVSATPQLRPLAEDLPLAIVGPEAVPVPTPRVVVPVRVMPPVRRVRTQGLLRVEGAIDAGATPRVAADVVGVVGLLRPRVRVELHGLYTVRQALQLGGTQVGSLARWAVGARGCGRVVQRRLEVPLCAGIEAGQFLGSGGGITVDRQSPRPPWLALLAGLGLIWSPHPRVGLGVRAELVLAPIRAGFRVGEQVVHTVDPAGVRVGFGIEVRLGDGTGPGRPQPR